MDRFIRLARHPIAALLVALVISSPAAAADPSQDMQLTIGTGQFSCGKFIDYQQQRNLAQLDMIVQWFWGFFTAYNWRGSFGSTLTQAKQITPPDSPTVLLYITKYCNDHPLDWIGNAALGMIHDLGGPVYWHPERPKRPSVDGIK